MKSSRIVTAALAATALATAVPFAASRSSVAADAGSSGLPVPSGVAAPDPAAFQSMRGKPLDVVSVFPSRESWDAIQGTWYMEGDHLPSGFTGNLSVAVPLWPKDGSLQAAAAGDYDEQWSAFARRVAARFPNAYVRLGWEMNVAGFYWHATPENVDQWRDAFRRAAVAIKAQAPGLQIVFNPNAGTTGTLSRPTDAYPGNQYVDVIGLDQYDWFPALTSQENWEHQQNDPYKLNTYDRWAQELGKKLSISEWGVSRQDVGGGDNPEYINNMYSWMRERKDRMAYESYFNLPAPAADDPCRQDDTCDHLRSDLIRENPQSAAAYRSWMAR